MYRRANIATHAAGVIRPYGTCQLISMPCEDGSPPSRASGWPNLRPDRSLKAR